LEHDIGTGRGEVTSALAKIFDAVNAASANRETQKEKWNDYCSKVDDELRKTEKRIVPDAGPYVAISLIIGLALALAVFVLLI
jgi:hypothetical protein